MTNKELAAKIAELEKQIRELQARPVYVPVPIQVAPLPPVIYPSVQPTFVPTWKPRTGDPYWIVNVCGAAVVPGHREILL